MLFSPKAPTIITVSRANNHKTAKLCLEFPTLGWKKTLPNTLTANTHSRQCMSMPSDTSNPGAHRWEPAGRCSLIRSQACTLPDTLHPNATARTQTSIRSVPCSQNPLQSVPADQGVQVTHTFHSLSSEMRLEIEAVDNLTQKKCSMGMNTYLLGII